MKFNTTQNSHEDSATITSAVGHALTDQPVRYAGFWWRTLAALIDTVVLGVPIALFSAMLTAMGLETTGDVILQIIVAALAIALWLRFGATPGKILMGARIVDAKTGALPSLSQCVIRYLAYIPSLFVLCLGLIWVGFDRRKQGWHDKLAGTVVVLGTAKKEMTQATANKALA